MLDNEIVKKIEEFVSKKPRSIQEIAQYIGKNWRTIDRYIQEIKENFGTIDTRIFRKGTRGALKIVYWASMEKISQSVFQEAIEESILHGKKKEDFSAFDIFQHAQDKDKKAGLEETEKEAKTNLSELKNYLEKTEKQLLVFSGNLSWINLKNKEIDIFRIIEGLVKKNVLIKVICRTDITAVLNITKLMSLNFKYGKHQIEIRHREQPLRALVIDNKIIRLKEVKEPTGKIHESDKKIFIFYTIKNKGWAEWLSKIFWKLFNKSIDSRKRLKEISKISVKP